MSGRVAVTSAEFIRNIGFWQGEALRHPVSITHHGRERLVLATPDAFGVDSGGASPETAQALTALRADMAAMLSNLDDSYFSFDARQCVTGCNALAKALTGRAAKDMQGMTALEIMPQPLASIVHERVARVMRTRNPERFEASALDGRRFDVRIFPLHEGAAALFHNLTETHELRRDLERAQAMDAAVTAHSRAAIIRLDARARIEAVDEVFCRLSGFDRGDALGRRFLDFTAPSQRREIGELIERVLREGVTRESGLTLLSKLGSETPGQITFAPILSQGLAQGAQAIWSPTPDSHEGVRAA